MRLLWLASLAVFLVQAGNQARLEGNVFRLGTVQPVPGARVSLSRGSSPGVPAPPQPIRSIVADDQGKFIFQGLDEGSYDVQVQANGYLGAESSVDLSKGEVIRDMSIGVTAVATISGRLRDTSDHPLVSVPVQILRSTYDYQGRHVYKSAGVAQTNDRGEYRMYWVTPGRYYLLAGRPPTAVNPLTVLMASSLGGATASGNPVAPITGYAFYPGVTDFANARLIDLQPGSDFQADLVVTPYPRTFTIRGKLIDSRTGQPPPRASVSVSANGPGGESDRTGSDLSDGNYNTESGTLQIRNLLPGIYRLTAIVADPSVTGQGGPSTQSFGTMPVAITDSDIDGIVLGLTPVGSISGRLRYEGQLPANTSITNFQVEAVPIGPNAVAQQSLENMMLAFLGGTHMSADGTFRLTNLVPGDYRIEVTEGGGRLSLSGNSFLKEARFEGADVFGSALHFSGTSSGGLDIVVASGAGHINGTVTDARSQPMPNTQVVLVPDRTRNRPELYRVTSTDANGTFNLSTIPPGDYKVLAWESIEEFGWFDPDVLAKSETRGAPVHVSASSDQTVQVRVIPADGTR